MIRLWPWQYRGFVRRCSRYLLLLGLLQVVGMVILASQGPLPLLQAGVGFNRPITLWDLWLVQLAVWIGAGLLFLRLGVRVVCPKCLARLTHNRRHQLYYCGTCDEYFDDGTMQKLAHAPSPPPRPLSE